MPNASNLLEFKQITAFLTFDRVIKDPDFSIIHHIAKMEEFDSYIDTKHIKTLTDKALAAELLDRDTVNPLEFYAIKEFNTDKNYKSLYDDIDEIYLFSPRLRMADSIDTYIRSGFLSDIYIWNRKDDKRQRYDIFTMYGNNPIVKYITGPFDKCVEKIHPTLLYDWNCDRVFDIVETERFDGTQFFVSDYGFNLEPDDYGGRRLKNKLYQRKNVVAFPVYNQNHLSNIKG